MTAVTFTPAYADWYLTQTGTPARHAALEGWRIDATWDSGSDTSRAIRKMLGKPDEPGELWHTLVCEVGGVLGKVYVNVPARFVAAAKVKRLELQSEGRAA